MNQLLIILSFFKSPPPRQEGSTPDGVQEKEVKP